MSEMLPALYIARPGETAWSLSGQHTGPIDLPLTEGGQSNARHLGNQLREWAFAHVLRSPLRNYVVPRDCAVIAVLGLIWFGIALMRFRRMLVQIKA
jgi:Histidine phosphatase superfamily (branch 1)